MTRPSNASIKKIIDDFVGGPSVVLEALSEAMYETSSHLEGNWQDEATARRWRASATRVYNLSTKVIRHGG